LRAVGVDLAAAFRSELFVGHHDAVARAVLDGVVDVGATFVYLDRGPHGTEIIRNAGWGEADVHVLSKVGPIPCDVLTCNSRVPFHVRTTLQAALVESHAPELELSAEELFHADGFAPCAEDHFAPLAEMFDLVGEVPAPYSLHPPMPRHGR
jgi:ABC-type phosphate/phosphonate transport system substrate-binding protein